MNTVPSTPEAAYAAGQVLAYNNILTELDELARKIRREIASLTLPTRTPQGPQGGGSQ